MRLMMTAATTAVLLAGCSENEAAVPKAEAVAASLQAGEYEVTAKVDALRSTDKTTPETKSKVGDPPKVTRTCVPADGTIDAKVFAEGSETCKALDNYMRNGRMSLQYQCTRGSDGLSQLVDGNFKADSFEAKVTTSTYFAGSGDYDLTRSFTGKRVGDCTQDSATQ